MAEHANEEDAASAIESMFQERASEEFMTPNLCGRFLVTPGMRDLITVAFGGGGVYQLQDVKSGEITFHSVVKVSNAISMPRDVAAALAVALTQNLALPEDKNGE
jgi:hypothetical protein